MLAVTETALPGIGLSIPQVVEREAVPSVALRASGEMRKLPEFAPPLFGSLHEWTSAHGIEPVAHFFRYRRFGEDGSVELDVGNTLRAPVEASGDVISDEIPAGRYATAIYTGPYDRLYDAFLMLNGWLRGRGLEPAALENREGSQAGCQLEIYRISPANEADPEKWQTDLMIRLADQH